MNGYLGFEYEREISLGCANETDSEERRYRMLHNLGYAGGPTRVDDVIRFQSAHGLEPIGLVAGRIPLETAEKIDDRYRAACLT